MKAIIVRILLMGMLHGCPHHGFVVEVVEDPLSFGQLEESDAGMFRQNLNESLQFIFNLVSVKNDHDYPLVGRSVRLCDGNRWIVKKKNASLVMLLGASHQCELSSDTLAYAKVCDRLSSSSQRPIAGVINLCLSELERLRHMARPHRTPSLTDTFIHEIIHLLAFNDATYAGGDEDRSCRPVVVTKQYDDWELKNASRVEHTTKCLKSRAITDFVSRHFNCSTAEGAEIDFKSGVHWSERLFPEELMTKSMSVGMVVSNLTLALLRDSGWYTVNGSMAKELTYGKGMGCDFMENSCWTWIRHHQDEISPYCHVDKEETVCSPNLRGKATCVEDEQDMFHCPTLRPVSIAIRSSAARGMVTNDMPALCTDTLYQPPQDNFYLQNHCDTCRCFLTTPSDWHRYSDRCTLHETMDGLNASFPLCYDFECSNVTGGLIVLLGNKRLSCQNRPAARFTFHMNGTVYSGSIQCPNCEQLCDKCHNHTTNTTSGAVDDSDDDELSAEELCQKIFPERRPGLVADVGEGSISGQNVDVHSILFDLWSGILGEKWRRGLADKTVGRIPEWWRR